MTDTQELTPVELETRLGLLAGELYAATTAQIAELRAEYGLASPRAVPATGLIPDVVDGQLIEAAWGNAIRDRTVERFDTYAALVAQWGSAAVGSVAVTMDNGWMWYRKNATATGWVPISHLPPVATINLTGTGIATTPVVVGQFSIAAVPYPRMIGVTGHCVFTGSSSDVYELSYLSISGGQTVGARCIGGSAGTATLAYMESNLAANTAATLVMSGTRVLGGTVGTIPADPGRCVVYIWQRGN